MKALCRRSPEKESGAFGPYRQSLRLSVYQKYAEELIEKGCAYRCFLTGRGRGGFKGGRAKKSRPVLCLSESLAGQASAGDGG